MRAGVPARTAAPPKKEDAAKATKPVAEKKKPELEKKASLDRNATSRQNSLNERPALERPTESTPAASKRKLDEMSNHSVRAKEKAENGHQAKKVKTNTEQAKQSAHTKQASSAPETPKSVNAPKAVVQHEMPVEVEKKKRLSRISEAKEPLSPVTVSTETGSHAMEEEAPPSKAHHREIPASPREMTNEVQSFVKQVHPAITVVEKEKNIEEMDEDYFDEELIEEQLKKHAENSKRKEPKFEAVRTVDENGYLCEEFALALFFKNLIYTGTKFVSKTQDKAPNDEDSKPKISSQSRASTFNSQASEGEKSKASKKGGKGDPANQPSVL